MWSGIAFEDGLGLSCISMLQNLGQALPKVKKKKKKKKIISYILRGKKMQSYKMLNWNHKCKNEWKTKTGTKDKNQKIENSNNYGKH